MTETEDFDLKLMRASLLLDTDPSGAARAANNILAAAPGHTEAQLLLAAACRRLGDPSTAVAALQGLVREHPSPLLELELARAYVAAAQPSPALAALRRAVNLDPGLAEGWRELAALQFAAGDIRAGDEAYARYVTLIPEPAELMDARRAVAEYRFAEAESLLEHHLGQAPRDVVALHMLADIANRRENFSEAERRLRACLDYAPGFAAARYNLAQLLRDQDRNAEVLPLVDRLLAVAPDNIDYLSLKAHALRLLGRNREAVALMEGALRLHPQNEKAWLLCGHLMRETGQQGRAIEMYREALKLRPQYGRAYSSLANLKTFRFEPDDLEAMRSQLASGAVRGSELTHLEFALGKALEDRREFAESFAHYARGNMLHRATVWHDADAASEEARRAIGLFEGSFFSQRRGFGSSRADPIFIVGLPRSGSTLLEQILASHSQIEGTRELLDLPAVSGEMVAAKSQSGDYFEAVAALEAADAARLAEQYLGRTQIHRPAGKARFVDKMLGNFMQVGLIQLLFPNAAIIDSRRHPLACGFSCYKQLFARELGFTYDLGELGRFYRDYAQLMAHFDATLPGRVHRVHYEQMVANPEEEVRKLLDYCRLPFEAGCLQFYDNRRVVNTISSEQVRQPIYAHAVEQWRHYEVWLGPLKDALGDLVEHYPGA